MNEEQTSRHADVLMGLHAYSDSISSETYGILYYANGHKSPTAV